MSSDTTAADRRIMTRLGESHRVPLVNVREGDFAVLVGFPIAGLLAGSLLWDLLVVPLALAGVAIGVATVYAAPSHRTAWTWLGDVARYSFGRPRYTLSALADAASDGTAGSAAAYSPFVPDERTQDLTNVARAWPGTGVIEREDGAMEAFIKVTPANMDFAMSGDWERIQTVGERFANDELSFPLTVYTTTRAFPADRLVSRLTDRRDDPDVASNDAFAALITEYCDRRPADLADSRQHRYYLGVTVAPSDLAGRHEGESTPGERLTEIPIIGTLLAPLVAGRDVREGATRRQAMYERVREQLRSVESEIVEPIEGWESRRLSTLELFVLTAEFWNGVEYDDIERLFATEPAVGSSTARRED